MGSVPVQDTPFSTVPQRQPTSLSSSNRTIHNPAPPPPMMDEGGHPLPPSYSNHPRSSIHSTPSHQVLPSPSTPMRQRTHHQASPHPTYPNQQQHHFQLDASGVIPQHSTSSPFEGRVRSDTSSSYHPAVPSNQMTGIPNVAPPPPPLIWHHGAPAPHSYVPYSEEGHPNHPFHHQMHHNQPVIGGSTEGTEEHIRHASFPAPPPAVYVPSDAGLPPLFGGTRDPSQQYHYYRQNHVPHQVILPPFEGGEIHSLSNNAPIHHPTNSRHDPRVTDSSKMLLYPSSTGTATPAAPPLPADQQGVYASPYHYADQQGNSQMGLGSGVAHGTPGRNSALFSPPYHHLHHHHHHSSAAGATSSGRGRGRGGGGGGTSPARRRAGSIVRQNDQQNGSPYKSQVNPYQTSQNQQYQQRRPSFPSPNHPHQQHHHHQHHQTHRQEQRTPKQKKQYPISTHDEQNGQSSGMAHNKNDDSASPFRYNSQDKRFSTSTSTIGIAPFGHFDNARKYSTALDVSRRGSNNVAGPHRQGGRECDTHASCAATEDTDIQLRQETTSASLPPGQNLAYGPHAQFPVHGSEQPYLLYKPCINPLCPNVYHYLQQVYQPIEDSSQLNPHPHTHNPASTTTITIVEIPGMIQAPAWCELRPCGCTLCRECFTSIINNCQKSTISTLSSSSIDLGNAEGNSVQGDSSMEKIFTCTDCNSACVEFGPVNEELQNAVESAKALVLRDNSEIGIDEVTNHDHDPLVYEDDETLVRESEAGPPSALYGHEEEHRDTRVGESHRPEVSPSNNRDFDGFQSAQDINSKKKKNLQISPSAPTDPNLQVVHSEDASSSSTSISPLLQPRSGIRYARSDPPPSLPHSPLLPPVQQAYRTSDIRKEQEQEVEEENSELMPSMSFPTLSNIDVINLPSRKISTTSTATTTFDSPVQDTPDLGTWSSSSASSMPSSPETLQSPTLALRAVHSTLEAKEAPWRQRALPEYYQQSKIDIAKEIKRKEEETVGDEREHGTFIQPASPSGSEQALIPPVGLGLTFGTLTCSSSNAERKAASPVISQDQASITTEKIEEGSAASTQPQSRERSGTPAKRGKGRNKQRESTSPPVSQKSFYGSYDSSVRQASTTTPEREVRSGAQYTPSRPSRGRGRGRGGGGGGGYIAAHQKRMAEVAQHQAHTPRGASPGTVSFPANHSRTDTQSSVRTTGSSSASSASYSFSPHTHGRKVSMAENKLPKLPELLANPTQDQVLAWEDNKTRWWSDPWLGRMMGINERYVNGEKVMCRSDGTPLIKGRSAGVSWPVLKVHNIAFRTTIADIESFVPPGVLAPLDYNAQGIHILCDIIDGKTRPYAYVECISTEAAERLLQHSDGRYLAGRQVAFRPVTQKELALDLFPCLRKTGYTRDTIFGSATPDHSGSSQMVHSRQVSGPFMAHTSAANNLELFTEQDYIHLKKLFDITLPSPETGPDDDDISDQTENKKCEREVGGSSEDHNDTVYFSFPPERPFARLVSMIVKYPWHALEAAGQGLDTRTREIDRLLSCSLDAMDKLAPNIEKRPELRSTWLSLYRAAVQCPAFDGARKEVFSSAWERLSYFGNPS